MIYPRFIENLWPNNGKVPLFVILSFSSQIRGSCYRIWSHDCTVKSPVLQPLDRLLLVADPQLPGYWNQPGSVLGTMSRRDSDSYIARTYSQALHYSKPDIVVFLGKKLSEK